ncbi:MAG: transcriptional repressor [Lachnospiraceae bacterium]|nr:transcriptional repressor [Lachnospiraceae bacterium]
MNYNTAHYTAILEYFRNNRDTIISAAKLRIVLKDYGINVSRATIYRILDRLSDEEKIVKVQQLGKETYYKYYDSQKKNRNAILLRCKKCGKVIQHKNTIFGELCKELFEKTGFDVDKGNQVIYGCCKNCNK